MCFYSSYPSEFPNRGNKSHCVIYEKTRHLNKKNLFLRQLFVCRKAFDLIWSVTVFFLMGYHTWLSPVCLNTFQQRQDITAYSYLHGKHLINQTCKQRSPQLKQMHAITQTKVSSFCLSGMVSSHVVMLRDFIWCFNHSGCHNVWWENGALQARCAESETAVGSEHWCHLITRVSPLRQPGRLQVYKPNNLKWQEVMPNICQHRNNLW